LQWSDELAQAADRIQRTLCVKRFPCHERLQPLLSYLARDRTSWLLEVNLETTSILAGILGLQTRFALDCEEPKPQWAKTDNLAARILRHTNEGTYLAGGGATQYLDPITFPFPIEWQTLQPKISSESILQLIATEPNPLAAIWQAGRWNVQ
jgi:hypothetical protein